MDEALNHRLGELLIELRDGNSLALADIDALIGKRLRAYANIYYMQQPDVDDAVQSLLCKLYQASKSFRENKNAYSWIIKLFKNMIISQIRRVKREYDYVTQNKETFLYKNDSTSKEYVENHVYYRDVLSSFKKSDREIIEYYFILEFSLSEVAKILRKPKSTVEYQAQKIKEKLQNMID